MGLYEGIKDIAGLVQKADNIDLYRKLLDLGAQALDMQKEIMELRQLNKELKEEINQERIIIRHKDGLYVTLEEDTQNIHYCSTCWGKDKKLIQLTTEDRCYECEKSWYVRHN